MKKIVLPRVPTSSTKDNTVISSYICIVRNIDALIFPENLIEEEKILIENQLVSILTQIYTDEITTIHINNLSDTERLQLQSTLHLSTDTMDTIRIIFAKNDGSWILVPNNHNHISIFSLAYGHSLKELYQSINSLLLILDPHIHFAYTPELGFASADINFSGNGLYMSVLLNLTGLELKGLIKELQTTCRETGYILNPYTSHPNSGLFLLKNIGSFGISESDHINHITQLTQKILKSEIQAKKEVLSDEENKELFVAQINQLHQQDSISYVEAAYFISLIEFLDKNIYSIQNKQLWLEQLFQLQDNSHHFIDMSSENTDQYRAVLLKYTFSQIVKFK